MTTNGGISKYGFDNGQGAKESVTPGELLNFNLPANDLLNALALRRGMQNDISQQKTKEIDVLSDKQIVLNIRHTTSFFKSIQKQVDNIGKNIDELKKKEVEKSGAYGLTLELHIPKLQQRYENIQNRITAVKMESLTSKKLESNEEKIIVEERSNIQQELNKFEEDLREYF